jgi:hypothetical protein
MILCPNNRFLSNIYVDETMDHPSALDICCGRGKGRWNSPGNRRFKELVHDFLQQYSSAPSKAEKSRVVEAVVKAVQKMGGRFIKRDEANGKWYEISPMESRSKVAHAIRDHLATCKRNLVHTNSDPKASRLKQARRSRSDSTSKSKKRGSPGSNDSQRSMSDDSHLLIQPEPQLVPMQAHYEPTMEPISMQGNLLSMALVGPEIPRVQTSTQSSLSESSTTPYNHYQAQMLPMQGQRVSFETAPEHTSSGEGFGPHHQELSNGTANLWPQLASQHAHSFLGLHPMAARNVQEQNLGHFYFERQEPPAGDSRVFNLAQGNASLHQPSMSQVSQSMGGEIPSFNNTARLLPNMRSQIASTAPAPFTSLQRTSQEAQDGSMPSKAKSSGFVPSMVSHRVPMGVVKQSLDFIDEQCAASDHDDMEPHAVFPPDE